MYPRRSSYGRLIVAAVAALGAACAAGQTAAQEPVAMIEFVPANSNPPIPAGLKVTCLDNPNTTQPSTTCPIVKYQGITTWAYSYIDNRVSLALVGYDSKNKVVFNVEKPGVRYVFDALSSLHTKTVMFVGQAQKWVSVPWSDLGPK
jgi:hypothetical protein